MCNNFLRDWNIPSFKKLLKTGWQTWKRFRKSLKLSRIPRPLLARANNKSWAAKRLSHQIIYLKGVWTNQGTWKGHSLSCWATCRLCCVVQVPSLWTVIHAGVGFSDTAYLLSHFCSYKYSNNTHWFSKLDFLVICILICVGSLSRVSSTMCCVFPGKVLSLSINKVLLRDRQSTELWEVKERGSPLRLYK